MVKVREKSGLLCVKGLFVHLILMLALAAFLLGVLGPEAVANGETYEYIGVKKCKVCHKKASGGDQYGLWLQRKHSKAFETLATDAALADAKKQGIEDPQSAPECLKCHATAFAVMDDLENQKITLEEGVSCEGCHGPGSGYKKMKTMKGLFTGEIEPVKSAWESIDFLGYIYIWHCLLSF